LILLCIGLLSYRGFTKYSEGTNLFRSTSTKARIGSTENALLIFQKNPFLGVGFNTYRYAQKRYKLVNSFNKWEIDHGGAGTDNSFLFILATTGIIGITSYSFLWIKTLLLAKKNLGKNNIAPVLIASSVGLFVDSFFINSLFYPFILAWMWIVIGLTEEHDVSSKNSLQHSFKK